jgi:hypothetical protein
MKLPAITPGPWKADTNPGCRQIKAYSGRRAADHKRQWNSIACTDGLTDDHVDEANAKAIAAVPPSLKALLPFARYALLPGADIFPDEYAVSKGSSFAAPQLTMGDCRAALAALRLAGATE